MICVQVRRQSFMEMQIFKKRWNNAVKDDKCWVNPYQQPVEQKSRYLIIYTTSSLIKQGTRFAILTQSYPTIESSIIYDTFKFPNDMEIVSKCLGCKVGFTVLQRWSLCFLLQSLHLLIILVQLNSRSKENFA
ncbi:hypothetical protein CsSME_00043367 [Camellia sinensis var. sinensis]